ncbi:MAG: thermonuclease family protein [Pseudomonadota bacterium]
MIHRMAVVLMLLLLIVPVSAHAEEVSNGEAKADDVGESAATGEPTAAEAMAGTPITGNLFEGRVTRVVDGGTVEIDRHRMHLLGVAAPRRWWWGKPRDCNSIEAASFLENAILGKTVGYGYDRVQGLRDSRGIKRIYLYIDGRLINADLIAGGFVLADRSKEYAERDAFLKLESDANLHLIGLWHSCPVECSRNAVCRAKNW